MNTAAKSRKLVVVLACAISGSAFADVNINTLPGATTPTSGWIGTAESFYAPAGNDALLSWQFALDGRSSPGDVTFSIVPWSPSGPSGAPLYTTTIAWGTSPISPVVSGINVLLTSGQLYAAEIDLQGYTGSSVYYGSSGPYLGGEGYWTMGYSEWSGYSYLFQGFDADFACSVPTGVPSAVPEPTTLIPGALLLLPFGSAAFRQFRKKFRAT